MLEFADYDFEFSQNGRNFSKWLENIVGKGEIARYEQFLLFPLFSKDLYGKGLIHCLQMPPFWSGSN